MTTGAEIRAARALLGWDRFTLVQRAKIKLPALIRAEGGDGEPSISVEEASALRRTLEAAGIEFTAGAEPVLRSDEGSPSGEVAADPVRAGPAKQERNATMGNDKDARIANAEARFRKAEAKAAEGAEAKAAHEAELAARDANTDRLKSLRLARDESDRVAAAALVAAKKPKRAKPRSAS